MKKIFILLCTTAILYTGYGETSKVRLDSIIQEGSLKYVFQYDDLGHETLRVGYVWNQTAATWMKDTKIEQSVNALGNVISYSDYKWNVLKNAWTGNSKYVAEYNIQDLLSEYISYNWNAVSMVWSPGSKKTWQYNIDGDIVVEISALWNTASNTWLMRFRSESTYIDGKRIASYESSWDSQKNDWNRYSKTEYSYDANGNQILSKVYLGDAIETGLTIYSKEEFSYNTANKITSKNSFRWETDKWVDVSKSEYAYDQMFNLVAEAQYTWNKSSQVWEGVAKREMTYSDTSVTSETTYNWRNNAWGYSLKTDYTLDAHGKVAVLVIYRWNVTTQKWLGYLKDELGRDIYGNVNFRIQYSWNTTVGVWESISKTEKVFDAKGNMIEDKVHKWDPKSQAWVGSYKHELGYDSAILSSTLAVPKDMGPYKIISSLRYNWENNAWVALEAYQYYYSDNSVTAVAETFMVDGPMRVYPNPTSSGILHLETTMDVLNIEVRDVCNQLVQRLDASDILDLSHLVAGVYVLHMNTTQGIQVRKVVKE